MAFDFDVGDLVPLEFLIEPLPVLLVLDWDEPVPLSALPVPCLPARQPFADSFAHVGAVGEDLYLAGTGKGAESLE